MVPHTHDFKLPVAQGGPDYHLAANDGKVRAFMFGSVTNPPSRFQMDQWGRLLQKYDSTEVQLFVIYGRELHPGDKGAFKRFPMPQNMDEKMTYARSFAELGNLPVLVDGMDDQVLEKYGRVPNGAYVVDKDGRLVFRGTWADARKIEHIIDTLLKWYRAGKPKNFSAAAK